MIHKRQHVDVLESVSIAGISSAGIGWSPVITSTPSLKSSVRIGAPIRNAVNAEIGNDSPRYMRRHLIDVRTLLQNIVPEQVLSSESCDRNDTQRP